VNRRVTAHSGSATELGRHAGATGGAGRPAAGRVPSPYLIVCVLTVIYAAVLAYRQPWGSDFGLHAAVVDAMRHNLWHPSDPMVDEAVRSPYFSPYMLLLGAAARITGASGLATLTAAAPFCVAVVLWGLGRFVRIFSVNRWAPVAALAFLLGLWGTAGGPWSGFFNLRGFALIMPYPSTLALGLTLLWWAALWAALEGGGTLRWVGVGALFGVIALVHPFTAIEAAIGAVALALPHLTRLRVRGVLPGVAAAVVVVLLWPYFSILDVARAAQDLDAIHEPLYVDVWGAYLAVLVICTPALVVRLRRSYVDPLAWIFILAMGVVATGWLTERWALGRAWPLAMVAAQVAVAVEICTAAGYVWRGRGLPARRLAVGAWCVLIVATLAVGAVAQMDRPRLLPTDLHQVYSDRLAPLTRHIAGRDVLITNNPGIARDLLGFGVRSAAPPWPDPALPDAAERERAVEEFKSGKTSQARRRELIEQYHVKWVLDTNGSWGWAGEFAVAEFDLAPIGRLYQVSP
jgi:hypothetical protein